jgi:hypothetical protein
VEGDEERHDERDSDGERDVGHVLFSVEVLYVI